MDTTLREVRKLAPLLAEPWLPLKPVANSPQAASSLRPIERDPPPRNHSQQEGRPAVSSYFNFVEVYAQQQQEQMVAAAERQQLSHRAGEPTRRPRPLSAGRRRIQAWRSRLAASSIRRAAQTAHATKPPSVGAARGTP